MTAAYPRYTDHSMITLKRQCTARRLSSLPMLAAATRSSALAPRQQRRCPMPRRRASSSSPATRATSTPSGVQQSDAEAARLFKLAANQGNADAQVNLGVLYRNGRGVQQSDAEAA